VVFGRFQDVEGNAVAVCVEEVEQELWRATESVAHSRVGDVEASSKLTCSHL